MDSTIDVFVRRKTTLLVERTPKVFSLTVTSVFAPITVLLDPKIDR